MFPGTLAGWAEVLERHGTRSLSQTLEPAIEHARRGVPARPVVVDFIARLKCEVLRFPELAGIFLPGDRVPRAGQIIKNRDLADTYEEITESGAAHFYEGPALRSDRRVLQPSRRPLHQTRVLAIPAPLAGHSHHDLP